MPTKTKTKPVRSDAGDLELHYAKDLTVLPHLQRHHDKARLKKLAKDWDPEKEGILLVARLTDGAHKGELHVYDGATRLLSKKQETDPAVPADPEYVFVTYVRDMTEQEAAKAFIDFNMLSAKPSAIDQYHVGLEANEPLMVAISKVVADMGLSIGAPTTKKQIQAVSSLFSLMKKAQARHKAKDWTRAAAELRAVLEFTHSVYPDSDANAGDLLRAVYELFAMNDRPSKEKLERLRKAAATKTVAQWRHSVAISTPSGSVPAYGTNDRPRVMAELLGYEANKRLRKSTLKWHHPMRGWTTA